jgi:hypothetical protein
MMTLGFLGWELVEALIARVMRLECVDSERFGKSRNGGQEETCTHVGQLGHKW